MHKEAWQRVHVGIRHMHREHFIFSNPTCALRAPFVEHTEAVWGASPIPAAQPVALFARLDQEFSC